MRSEVADLVRRLSTRADFETAGLLAADVPPDVEIEVAYETARSLGLSAAVEVLGLVDPSPRLAAALCGIGQACLDVGVAYAKDRVVFGKPLSRNAVQRNLFARATAEVEAAWALVRRAVASGDPLELSALPAVAAEAAWLAADTALQVHGGYGYTDEYPISRMWTEVVAARAALPPRHGAT